MVVIVFVTVFDEFFTIESAEDAVLEKKESIGVGLISELEVGFEHVLMGAIDVEVVGVGSGNDRNIRVELEERAVVFISLDNHIFAFVVDHEITVEVLADASKESAASADGL